MLRHSLYEEVLGVPACKEELFAATTSSASHRTQLRRLDASAMALGGVRSTVLSRTRVVLRAATMRAMDRQPFEEVQILDSSGTSMRLQCQLVDGEILCLCGCHPKGEKVGEAIRRYVDSNQGTKYVEYFSD